MKTIYDPQPSNLSRGQRMDRLTQSGTGRVALHVLCVFRHPGHLRWHWRGIVRELNHILPVLILAVSLGWTALNQASA